MYFEEIRYQQLTYFCSCFQVRIIVSFCAPTKETLVSNKTNHFALLLWLVYVLIYNEIISKHKLCIIIHP